MSTRDEARRALRETHEPPWGGELVRHYLRDLVYGANDGIITTFAAFLVAGSVPLLPYALTTAPWRFEVAVAATLAALFTAGALRALVTRLRWWVAGGEMLLIGAAAAAISYGIGALLGRLT